MAEGMIAASFDTYRETLGKAAGPVQIAETRRAFYSGAAAVFYGLAASLSDGDEDTPEDIMIMEGLQREIDAFRASLAEAERS